MSDISDPSGAGSLTSRRAGTGRSGSEKQEKEVRGKLRVQDLWLPSCNSLSSCLDIQKLTQVKVVVVWLTYIESFHSS